MLKDTSKDSSTHRKKSRSRSGDEDSSNNDSSGEDEEEDEDKGKYDFEDENNGESSEDMRSNHSPSSSPSSRPREHNKKGTRSRKSRDKDREKTRSGNRTRNCSLFFLIIIILFLYFYFPPHFFLFCFDIILVSPFLFIQTDLKNLKKRGYNFFSKKTTREPKFLCMTFGLGETCWWVPVVERKRNCVWRNIFLRFFVCLSNQKAAMVIHKIKILFFKETVIQNKKRIMSIRSKKRQISCPHCSQIKVKKKCIQIKMYDWYYSECANNTLPNAKKKSFHTQKYTLFVVVVLVYLLSLKVKKQFQRQDKKHTTQTFY
ncbi:DNA topoisomerase type I [Reticulomyxa filosa]|uniref:DNA topoisomerase type I n=1 Tax=Reticulomyxa filosa TaxID=46433 RepID=X6NBX4_RETFI|nr:DNA topoisomerase type I [Reticulomyxa filosa]|eukprot:ETO23795.1 DNA topoisomerase type I [Reticulomyxa filosa]